MSARGVLSHARLRAADAPAALLVSGWGRPEKAHTWSIGTDSVLRLAYDLPRAPCDLQIEFSLVPFIADPRPATQRLEVWVEGQQVGSENLHGPTWVGFRLPREAFPQTGTLSVRFSCPDATAPASIRSDRDARQLGFSFREALVRGVPVSECVQVRRRPPAPLSLLPGGAVDTTVIRGLTALAPVDLALNCESLGCNCEFGLFQRRCGAEPLGLLRFAGLSYLDLVRGLASGFANIDSIDNLSCHAAGPGSEWIVRAEHFGMEFHTSKLRGDISASQLLAEQSRVLAFRRAKLLELLATGEKLFVVNRPQGMTAAQALPLMSVLRSYGPNALLFVSDQTDQAAGTVEALATDLFCGSMDGVPRGRDDRDRNAGGNDTWLGDAATTTWLSVCANAYRMWREEGGGTPPDAGACGSRRW